MALGAFLFLTAFASAQRSVQVTLPTGDFALFASHGPATGPSSDAVASKGGTVTFQMSAGQDHLYLWDKGSDNLAMHSSDQLKSPWIAQPTDFNHLASLTVKTLQGTNPLGSGETLIKDGDARHSQIVDASGPVVLFDVKPGKVPVTVRYKGVNGETKEVTQEFDVDLTSGKDARTVTVAVEPGAPAAGTAAGANATAKPEAAAKPAEGGTILGTILGWLIGLAIAIAIILGLMTYMKRNSDSVASKLEQLGVQVPKAGDDALTQGAVPYTPDPIKPQPVQKIVLDDAVVTPLAAAPVMPTMAAPGMTVSEPSLVSDSGVPIPLPEGETVVGREPGLGLSLTAESTVSRRHATLTRAGGEVTVSDAGSSNGTFVNGSRLSSPVTLRPGDQVQFGSAKFQFQA